MPPQWAQATLVSKLKVHLKMAIQRLRMLQQKASAIAKQQRRQMAELLATGKLESARIRVENIIRSDITTELHEILELYCELLLARIQLLEQLPAPSASSSSAAPASIPAPTDNSTEDKEPTGPLRDLDSGLDEAVRSLIYAAPRTDLKELTQARNLLVEKTGKEYVASCVAGVGIPDRVKKRVVLVTPPKKLVDDYLREIGRTYGVRFPGDPSSEDEELDLLEDEEEEDEDEPGDDHAQKEKALETPLRNVAAEELDRATPPRGDVGDEPLKIAPPSPSTENVAPRIRLPGGEKVRPSVRGRKSSGAGGGGAKKGEKSSADGTGKTGGRSGGGPGGKIPDVDELERRFAALKKL